MSHDDSTEVDDIATDEFGVATDGFREALSSAFGSPETERVVVDLFDAYASVFRDAAQAPAVVTLAAQRFEPYSRAVAAAFASPASRAKLDDAFREYVLSIQSAWINVDPGSIVGADLASIAEEMQWVAGVMSAVDQVVEDPSTQ
jgi:hypothetical protein